MNTYDFKSLSYIEFELLAKDLLQKELDLSLESFKNGKDGGIDLRYCEDVDETIIIQCKHYTSGFPSLFSSLKKELIKVKKLNPKRYLLVTSTPLSRENKRRIVELFGGYIKRQKDIYGCESLNAIIRKNDDIEQKHFKLWLSSINIMNKVIHNNINNRSQYKIEEIKNKFDKYVPNKSFKNAENILDEANYVVISGPPGIGKSTLAEFLIWHYLARDFEFIEVSSDIEEAWTMLKPDSEKQVFYYDDFLGKTNFQISSSSKNEDKRLIQFIEKVQKSKNKKFLLTTREYILKEAKAEFEYLDSFALEKCIIPLADYTKTIRAKILYNHLYFSELPYTYIEKILEDEKYLPLINHPNYNPRIIDYFTTLTRIKKTKVEDYCSSFLEALEYPSDIWNHIYNKINDESKAILLSLITVRYSVDMNKLYTYSEQFYKNITKEEFKKSDFKKSLKILEGDFIKISVPWGSSRFVSLINPSLQDFIEGIIVRENEQELLLNSIEEVAQFEYFFDTFLTKKKNSRLFNLFFGKLEEKCILEPTQQSISTLTLMLKAIRVSKNIDFLVKVEKYFKLISDLNPEIISLKNLFNEIEYSYYQDNAIINNFLLNCKNNILVNIKSFDNYYENIEAFKQIHSFSLLCDEQIFDKEEQEIIKTEITNSYETISKSIEENSYGSYDFEDNLNDFDELIGFFGVKSLRVTDELDYLNKRLNEVKKEEAAEVASNNKRDNSLATDKSISKNEDMSENDISQMFESLKYSKL